MKTIDTMPSTMARTETLPPWLGSLKPNATSAVEMEPRVVAMFSHVKNVRSFA